MKNIKISMGIFALVCIVNSYAYCATKCVALTSSTTCTGEVAAHANKSDWSMSCTTSGTSVSIKGIGVCSAKSASSAGTKSDNLDMATGSIDTTKYCWCKMTSPAVSSWVFVLRHDTPVACVYSCAANCVQFMNENQGVRSSIFSTLGD